MIKFNFLEIKDILFNKKFLFLFFSYIGIFFINCYIETFEIKLIDKQIIDNLYAISIIRCNSVISKIYCILNTLIMFYICIQSLLYDINYMYEEIFSRVSKKQWFKYKNIVIFIILITINLFQQSIIFLLLKNIQFNIIIKFFILNIIKIIFILFITNIYVLYSQKHI